MPWSLGSVWHLLPEPLQDREAVVLRRGRQVDRLRALSRACLQIHALLVQILDHLELAVQSRYVDGLRSRNGALVLTGSVFDEPFHDIDMAQPRGDVDETDSAVTGSSESPFLAAFCMQALKSWQIGCLCCFDCCSGGL